MALLTDSDIRKNAHIKAEEQSLLRKQRLALVAKRREYSDENKIETIKTFLAMGGNLSLTAAACGISRNTLKMWKATNWWNEVITELRKAEKLELSASTKKILTKSLALLEDRLEHGDYIYDQKQGKLIRKALNARDIHKIAIDMMDRKDKLDEATSSEEHIQSNEEKMEKLMERFAALAVKAAEKKISQDTGSVVDVQFKEV
jgi:transposase-like protein